MIDLVGFVLGLGCALCGYWLGRVARAALLVGGDEVHHGPPDRRISTRPRRGWSNPMKKLTLISASRPVSRRLRAYQSRTGRPRPEPVP